MNCLNQTNMIFFCQVYLEQLEICQILSTPSSFLLFWKKNVHIKTKNCPPASRQFHAFCIQNELFMGSHKDFCVKLNHLPTQKIIILIFLFRSAKMMPSSPMLGRRSGTNSPKMDRLDFVKDSVIGELSSRIGKPIPEFNKNKRGKEKLILKDINFVWMSTRN